MSSDVDERGYYRDRQRVRTTLLFARVANLRINGLYSQNVISELSLNAAQASDHDEVLGLDHVRAPRRCHVRWGSSLGMAAEFLCDEITVLKAEPCARAT
jgi:hypothetical protein